MRDFFTDNPFSNSLKRPSETIDKITFHCAYRLDRKGNKAPRPIIAKFEHYQQKELVRSKGRELKATDFGINEQFPKEVSERHKSYTRFLKSIGAMGDEFYYSSINCTK